MTPAQFKAFHAAFSPRMDAVMREKYNGQRLSLESLTQIKWEACRIIRDLDDSGEFPGVADHLTADAIADHDLLGAGGVGVRFVPLSAEAEAWIDKAVVVPPEVTA